MPSWHSFNPNNVTEADGSLKLTLSSDDYAGCAHSGAEIKTFSTDDDSFKEFKFTLILILKLESKTYLFPKAQALLFGYLLQVVEMPEYREIDIWETYSGHKMF
ncbi:MAG: hypothetical protein IPI65_16705 [Bacteroidetes bacterium]|nr:hypothetical protein [Bacteroidota bacterium]